MRVPIFPAVLGALAASALVLSACSSGSSESASPTVATPAAESVEAIEASGDFMIGDAGPGGGVVFFDAGSVQPWGQYLEAGPQLVSTEWCGENWESDIAGTLTTIGTGAANTTLMSDACEAGAAISVREFDGGGKTDWFLPSKDELNVLYEQRDIVGGFGVGNEASSMDAYWSSSQSPLRSENDVAWIHQFKDGLVDGEMCKCNIFGVRPVRAF